MIALKQLAFSLAFATAAVAAAQYIMSALNGQPWMPWPRALRFGRLGTRQDTIAASAFYWTRRQAAQISHHPNVEW
jgi:hypothetical protein